jgi:methionyl-tRNA synthetase
MLGLPADPRSWETLTPRTLPLGTQLGKTEALFPRMEHSLEELQRMGADQREAPPSTAAPQHVSTSAPQHPVDRISIDDFMKVELRVAKVLAAERVPKSKKLLKLQVDVGTEHRTMVAGIAEAYDPDTLVGRSVVVVVNLQPATLMGVESNGMVLAASPDGGKPMLLSVDDPPPPGTRVR